MNNVTVEINENETEAQRLGRMIKYLRLSTGMKREDFANYFHIPLGTVRDWEQGKQVRSLGFGKTRWSCSSL